MRQKLSFIIDFTDAKTFGLTNLLRRTSITISSNIAKGSRRNSNKDFSRYLAIGSGYKLKTQLLMASDLGFNSKENKKQIA